MRVTKSQSLFEPPKALFKAVRTFVTDLANPDSMTLQLAIQGADTGLSGLRARSIGAPCRHPLTSVAGSSEAIYGHDLVKKLWKAGPKENGSALPQVPSRMTRWRGATAAIRRSSSFVRLARCLKIKGSTHPRRRVMRTLLATATIIDGLLAGASVDQSIEQLPARHRIGIRAYQRYSQASHMANGRFWLIPLGIGGPVLRIAAAILARGLPSRRAVPVYVAGALGVAHRH